MSDAEALLRAILDAPDDDAPRLVYADWLDEHDDSARGAFIRAQIELARMADDDPARTRLVETEQTLLNANRAAWTAWRPAWVTEYRFRRGFIDRIRCDAATFLAEGDQVRRKTPLTGVRLGGRADIAVPVFRSRALEGLRSLTLSIVVPAADWQHLAESPYLGQLTHLDLSSNLHSGEMVSALVGSTAFPMLRSLRLRECALGDEHAARLVRHRWVERLRALDLRNNYIGPEGGLAIAGSPFLEGIEKLILYGNALSANAKVVQTLRDRFGERVRLHGS